MRMAETKRRHRRIFSISHELIEKSREAALAAVQIFNNPQVTFKSEIFIVLMNIAWTYLLHAYYRKKEIEYRYFEQKGKRRRFDYTKGGAYKYWELERCLNDKNSPVDKDSANNLGFLIGIRHEIEHQMTTRIDASLSAKFQACCLNYNDHVKKLFGNKFGIDKHLAFSLQFSSISREQADTLAVPSNLPSHIKSFVEGFEGKLSEAEFNSPKFAYRVLFVAKTANRKGQADQVVEFVKADSEFAKQVNATYVVTKEIERRKYRPGNIVETMHKEGYPHFNMHAHTEFWKAEDAKNSAKGLGVSVEDTWYWYEPWLEKVRTHCKQNETHYK
jgi:hypothetical protein